MQPRVQSSSRLHQKQQLINEALDEDEENDRDLQRDNIFEQHISHSSNFKLEDEEDQ